MTPTHRTQWLQQPTNHYHEPQYFVRVVEVDFRFRNRDNSASECYQKPSVIEASVQTKPSVSHSLPHTCQANSQWKECAPANHHENPMQVEQSQG